jgi:hypothetical protein
MGWREVGKSESFKQKMKRLECKYNIKAFGLQIFDLQLFTINELLYLVNNGLVTEYMFTEGLKNVTERDLEEYDTELRTMYNEVTTPRYYDMLYHDKKIIIYSSTRPRDSSYMSAQELKSWLNENLKSTAKIVVQRDKNSEYLFNGFVNVKYT